MTYDEKFYGTLRGGDMRLMALTFSILVVVFLCTEPSFALPVEAGIPWDVLPSEEIVSYPNPFFQSIGYQRTESASVHLATQAFDYRNNILSQNSWDSQPSKSYSKTSNQISSSINGVSGRLWGEAGHGSLKAEAYSGGLGNASAYYYGSWHDAFYIGSSKLMDGDPVRMYLSWILDSVGYADGQSSYARAETSVTVNAASRPYSVTSLLQNETWNYLGGRTPVDQDFQVTTLALDVYVGEIIELDAYLTAVAGSIDGTAALRAGHSSELYIDWVSPDAEVTTLSGATYLRSEKEPVPEPSTFILLSAGIATSWLVMRRKKLLGYC